MRFLMFSTSSRDILANRQEPYTKLSVKNNSTADSETSGKALPNTKWKQTVNCVLMVKSKSCTTPTPVTVYKAAYACHDNSQK